MVGIIQGQGATKVELDYLGLTELLKGNKKITKENLLKHIKEKDISSRITTTQIPDKDREVVEYEGFRLSSTDSETFETYVMQFDATPKSVKVMGEMKKIFDTVIYTEAINRSNGNISAAANSLGVTTRTIRNCLKSYEK